MYISDKSGLTVYETLDEILDSEIVISVEYQGSYYFRLKVKDPFDNRMWKVDKNTKKIESIYFTDYFDFEDKAKTINPETLRRAS